MAYTETTPRNARAGYEAIKTQLWNDRSSFMTHWQELSQFILPRRTRYFVTDRNKGDRRNQKIINSTATLAARTLRSGLSAGVSSPARPWFKLSTPDPDLADHGPVKEWLHVVTERMRAVFLRSNLYGKLPISYGDLGVFGTSAISVMEDPRHLIRCESFPVGSYALAMSHRQVVDTFVREYELTVKQVVNEFLRDPDGDGSIDWSRASSALKNLWDKGNMEAAVKICWIVAPNPDVDPSMLAAKYLPYTSTYFESGGSEDKFLRRSGFHEMPILGFLWETTGEDSYATSCPGMDALGDIKGLQLMERRKAQAIEKQINPPTQAPVSLMNQKVSALPGDVNYVDVGQGQQGVRSLYDVQARIEAITESIAKHEYRISRAFFEDLFLMLANSEAQSTQRTATEINERHEEKLIALGPVLQNTNDTLSQLIDRTYSVMERAGAIPPPPDELVNVDLKIEFVSVLAEAQKLVGVAGLDRFMGVTINAAQVFPEARAKVRIFQVMNDYGEMLGVNPKSIVPDDEAQQIVDAQQQQAAAMQQSAMQEQAAKSAQALGNTDLEKDSALRRLVQGVQ